MTKIYFTLIISILILAPMGKHGGVSDLNKTEIKGGVSDL